VKWREDIIERVEALGIKRVGNQMMTTADFAGADGLKQGELPVLDK
jgi:hypothetical protein